MRIFALTTFDGSDTYGHVVAAKEIWLQLSQLLGPWFAEVFREQAAKPMFKKVGKDVKPKRDFVKKNIKELRTWLERIKTTFDGRYTEMLDVLDKRLESPFLMEHPGLSTIAREHREKKQREWHDFVTSSRRLLLLNGSQWGGRAGAEGLLDFWDKKPNGWSKLRLALEYFYWDVPIELRFKEARHQFFGCGDFGNKLALAIALGEWPTADYFCKQMLRVENFRVADSSLSRFLLKLYSSAQPGNFRQCAGAGKILRRLRLRIRCLERPSEARGCSRCSLRLPHHVAPAMTTNSVGLPFRHLPLRFSRSSAFVRNWDSRHGPSNINCSMRLAGSSQECPVGNRHAVGATPAGGRTHEVPDMLTRT